MEEFMVSGVLGVALVVGLVEVAKREGLPSKHAPLAALVAGVLVSLEGVAKAAFPAVAPSLDAVVFGLGLGLAAAGLYKGGKAGLKS